MRLNEVDEFETQKYVGPQEKLTAAERRSKWLAARLSLAQHTADAYQSRLQGYTYDKQLTDNNAAAGMILIPLHDNRGRSGLFDGRGLSAYHIQKLTNAYEMIGKLNVADKKNDQTITRLKLEVKKATGEYVSKKQLEDWQKQLEMEILNVIVAVAGKDYSGKASWSYTKRDGTSDLVIEFWKEQDRNDVPEAVYQVFQKLAKTRLTIDIKEWLQKEGFVRNKVSWRAGNSLDYKENPTNPKTIYNLRGYYDIKVNTDVIVKRYKK